MANVLKQLDSPRNLNEKFVHQSLHGYSGGHRLIESSLDCPDDVSSLMLRMSDLSGGNIVTGFEDYLTAYPLKSIGMYALAKTWLATEMSRPGCVWTHTLILSEAQLNLPSLGNLLNLFRRPQVRNTEGIYASVLDLNDSLQDEFDKENAIQQAEFSKRILTAFYKSNAPAILLPAKSSREYQQLIFELWSQQWPSLRRATTFSTGSLALRTFENRPFDIQCVPISAVREVQLEITSIYKTEVSIADRIPAQIPDWADEAGNDLLQGSNGEFRIFLWSVAEAESQRSYYAGFAQMHQALRRSELDSVLRLVNELFPNAEQAKLLKKLIFGGANADGRFSRFNETEILTALGSTENYLAFDSKNLQLTERGGKLAKNPTEAKRLIEQLFRRTINPLGAEILGSLISVLDPYASRSIIIEHPHFLSTLVAAKPSLAVSPQLWLGADDSKWEIFETVLRSQHLNDDTLKGVVWALLETESENLFRRALDVWGRKAVFGAMDWLDQTDGKLTENCRGSLTFHTTDVMDWVETGGKKSHKSLIATAHVVAPYSYQIKDRNIDIWEALEKETKGHENIYLATFLLALGLNNAPTRPIELIKCHFDTIYQLAWDEKLDNKTWEILDPIVPVISWPNNWDRCERMVRGLISAFIRFQWPPQQIFYCVLQPHIWDRFPKSAKKVDGGVLFLEKLVN
jgi:hypothetical protein